MAQTHYSEGSNPLAGTFRRIMRIGFDFHNVMDSYPNQIATMVQSFSRADDYVCVISAIGKRRIGTIKEQVQAYTIFCDDVFEVVFKHPQEAPAFKTAKAKELGLHIFFDDRQDVCDA